MTAQELRAKYCGHWATIVKCVLRAEDDVLTDPKVVQRVKDKQIKFGEYAKLIAEEIVRTVSDKDIAGYFGEELADETERQAEKPTDPKH